MSTLELPCFISPYMKKVLNALEKDFFSGEDRGWFNALKQQLIPSEKETQIATFELQDPLGSCNYQVTPRAVHQYKNRLLILTTAKCFSYCRHCFRRDYTARCQEWISVSEQIEICNYLKQHPQIQEVLFSGGDPLTVCDKQIEEFILRLRESSPKLLIRICTRANVFAPERITENLVAMFRRQRPLWVIPHINHPVEISSKYSLEARQSLLRIVDSGIPVQSQTVLLKGINDTVDLLAELFYQLTVMGIKPGYLFQTDLAAGTSHFRVPLEQGLKIYKSLCKELSGLSTPVYALDLPGGGGKINLLQVNSDANDFKVTKISNKYVFTKNDGKIWEYPDD